MLLKSIKIWLILSLACLGNAQAEPLSYYFPEQSSYRNNIPTPESSLGFTVGDRHVRHDQLVNYFQALGKVSSNIVISEMGYTNEHRKQIIATISSKENLANLDNILANRKDNHKQDNNAPAVVWLGYSIHGNEISGANAAMLVAYYLAAAKTPEVTELLDNLVIVIEPSMNPDGMDRFTTWVNTNRNNAINTDPETTAAVTTMATATPVITKFTGFFESDSAGTMNFQFSRNGGSGTLTLDAGSYIKACLIDG